jgi:hypothetical protein
MHLRRTDTLMPDNVDIALLINAPYAFVNFMSIIIRVRPRVRQLTRFTYSLDEAQAMVAEQRQHTSTLGNNGSFASYRRETLGRMLVTTS